MSHWALMYAALKSHVFPYLQEKGFEGVYPHFRRKNEDCVELISFAANPRGGSFSVSSSVAFPNRKNTNLIWLDDGDHLTAFHTKVRYSGMGMFERHGDFYYADVYRKCIKKNWFQTFTSYVTVRNAKEEAQWMAEGYECVGRFCDETPRCVCDLILTQLGEAFVWMEKFERKCR